MKTIQFTSIIALVISLFSCDTEDARTPLGITVSAPDFELEIEENPEEGITLGILTGIASDGSTITFGEIIDETDEEDSKFSSETPIGALDIDNATGELTIKDASLFEYSINTEINAVVDAFSGSVSEAINITILLTEILDLDSDKEALIALLEANTTTTTQEDDSVIEDGPDLNWDIELDIIDWDGVITENDRVTGLDVSGKDLTIISNTFTKLNQLTSLNLSSNEISDITDSFIDLDQLTSLDISSNNITSLSFEICEAFPFIIKDEEAICLEEVETTDTDTDTTN